MTVSLQRSIVSSVSQTTVLGTYLRDFCRRVGVDAYISSPIRRQHGNGTGIAGIGNAGGIDCLRERFRGISTALGCTYATWREIPFVSQGCLNIKDRNRHTHRVEHTRGLSEIFQGFERECIMGGLAITPYSVLERMVLQGICTHIRQEEQCDHGLVDPDRPFKRYSVPVYYQGQDVSLFNSLQLSELMRAHYEHVLVAAREWDWEPALARAWTGYTNGSIRGVPPMELAVRYHDCEWGLLEHHYHYRRSQLLDPSSRFHDPRRVREFLAWRGLQKAITAFSLG